jgi:hypothetical protein
MSAHVQPGDRGHELAPGRRAVRSERRADLGNLIGRHRECGTLDRLVEAVRAGESQALGVRGEPGAGKTVLLDYLVGRVTGIRRAPRDS